MPATGTSATGASSTGASAAEAFDLAGVLAVLRQAPDLRRRALRRFLVIFLPALLIAALLPQKFKATAVLSVLPSPEYTVRQDAGSNAFSSGILQLDQIMKSETAILESTALHDDTIADLGVAALYPDIADHSRNGVTTVLRELLGAALHPWWHAMPSTDAQRAEALVNAATRVLPSKDSNIVTVTFKHKDADMAARFLNRMLAQYARRRSRVYDDPQLSVVGRDAAARASAMHAAVDRLIAFKRAHGITNFDTERDLLLHRHDAAQAALADAQASQAAEAARHAALDEQMRAMPKNAPLYQEHDDTKAQAITADLLALQGRLADAQAHYRDSSHVVRDLRTRITLRQTELRQAAGDRTPSALRQGRSTSFDDVVAQRARAVADEDAAAARAVALSGTLHALGADIARLDGAEAELRELERQKALTEDAYATSQHILTQQGLTEAEDALRLANVRVIQPAKVPVKPEPLKLMVALAGFLLGALAAFWHLLLAVRIAGPVETA